MGLALEMPDHTANQSTVLLQKGNQKKREEAGRGWMCLNGEKSNKRLKKEG